jgi:archaellum component FlaC
MSDNSNSNNWLTPIYERKISDLSNFDIRCLQEQSKRLREIKEKVTEIHNKYCQFKFIAKDELKSTFEWITEDMLKIMDMLEKQYDVSVFEICKEGCINK